MAPRSVDYRTSARPELAFDLGRKPGPVVARRRVGPGYLVGFAALTGALVAVAVRTPDETRELIASSPLFSAVYTFSVVGLVGLVTLAFVRLAFLRGETARLRVGSEDLVLGRPEGELQAPIRAIHAEALVVAHGERERDGLDLRFPSGDRIRIVVVERDERSEHDDPWDYSLEEAEFAELRQRLARS